MRNSIVLGDNVERLFEHYTDDRSIYNHCKPHKNRADKSIANGRSKQQPNIEHNIIVQCTTPDKAIAARIGIVGFIFRLHL